MPRMLVGRKSIFRQNLTGTCLSSNKISENCRRMAWAGIIGSPVNWDRNSIPSWATRRMTITVSSRGTTRAKDEVVTSCYCNGPSWRAYPPYSVPATPGNSGLSSRVDMIFHDRRQRTWAKMTPPDLAHDATIAGEICGGCEPVTHWLTMHLRFEVYEANVRGSPVEFSFSGSRTSREELRARGARRTRKMRRKFGARYNAPKEGAMVEE